MDNYTYPTGLLTSQETATMLNVEKLTEQHQYEIPLTEQGEQHGYPIMDVKKFLLKQRNITHFHATPIFVELHPNGETITFFDDAPTNHLIDKWWDYNNGLEHLIREIVHTETPAILTPYPERVTHANGILFYTTFIASLNYKDLAYSWEGFAQETGNWLKNVYNPPPHFLKERVTVELNSIDWSSADIWQ